MNSKELTEERGKAYGHPLDDFKRINHGHEVIDQCKDPEVRHALFMVWLKICRLVETPDHQDSIDDIAGYAETINMIHKERARRGEDGWIPWRDRGMIKHEPQVRR